MKALTATRRPSASASRAAWLIAVAALAAFFVIPILWLLLAPTKTDSELINGGAFSFGSLHDLRLSWDHVAAFENGIIFTWLRNSAVYAAAALAITLVTAVPAGYGLALTQFAGRRLILAVTLTVMLVPNAALVLPVFLEMNAIHQIGSIWSVILPFSFFPFGVYLCYVYFSSSLPAELLAAARIDGCNEWQVFRRIAIPLAKPAIALVCFFSVVQNWNNFFLPLVMLPADNTMPIQVGLSNLLASTPAFNPVAGSAELHFNRPELALTTLLAIAPILLVFLISQRSLVSGMLAGATKG